VWSEKDWDRTLNRPFLRHSSPFHHVECGSDRLSMLDKRHIERSQTRGETGTVNPALIGTICAYDCLTTSDISVSGTARDR
jgi:hypothetical protein